MNERQKKFAELFASCGNAAQAAREAGYSAKTARQQGERLLTNDDILRCVRQLQDEAAASRISTMRQTKAFWSDTMNDKGQKMSDRLKASELLARAAGAFIHARPGDDDAIAAYGEAADEDVIIYLPKIQNESEVETTDEQE